jgi:sporulation protein YlmC with PRC-barrel domain
MKRNEVKNVDLPMNAEVKCAGELCGHISNLILNPVTDTVTHIVVKSIRAPHQEYVVPVRDIVKSSANCIHLPFSSGQLENRQHFIETHFLKVEIPTYPTGSYMVLPFVVPETKVVSKEQMHIPPGELAIHRGTQVNALERHVGQVDEFLVDANSGHITHLILREGHLWGKKDVVIPLSLIDRIEEDVVYLKAAKSAIDKLPVIPVQRKWECD